MWGWGRVKVTSQIQTPDIVDTCVHSLLPPIQTQNGPQRSLGQSSTLTVTVGGQEGVVKYLCVCVFIMNLMEV